MIEVHGKTLVALSGGADSVALLRMLVEQGAETEALHCNFHLRGKESDRDENFVTQLCQKLGTPLHVKHFDTYSYAKEHGISVEMAARELRYEWFETMRVKLGADTIALAHHRDDQVETVLLNLIRGTGLRGLAGMREQNGHLLRPLLKYTKEELLEYLKDKNQDYVIDSTNLQRDFLRNIIRLDIIPLLHNINPQASEHIAQTARLVAAALPYYLKGIEVSSELNEVTLHERLRGLGFTTAQEAEMLQTERTGAIFESSTHYALIDRGKLILESKDMRESRPMFDKNIVTVDDALHFLSKQKLSSEIAYLDADKVGDNFILRHPNTGDRFQPYGMKRGTRLLSDFLTDQKVNILEKRHQWLVCSGSHIVWVVGLRIDDRFRVTSNTHRILILKYK